MFIQATHKRRVTGRLCLGLLEALGWGFAGQRNEINTMSVMDFLMCGLANSFCLVTIYGRGPSTIFV